MGPNRKVDISDKVGVEDKAVTETKTLRTAEVENPALPIEVNFVPMNVETPNDDTRPNVSEVKLILK